MRRKIDRRTFLKMGGAATGAAIGGGVAAHLASDEDKLLMGVWRYVVPIPGPIWRSQVRGDPAELDFMSEQHHWVRDFVVTELPRIEEPLTPETVAQELNLPRTQVIGLLNDLEQHMTFVFRNDQGAVTWAYPVTVDRTPHHLTFSTGERLYAAWAIDAIATPFVQGRLREEALSLTITTSCAHCGEPLHIEMDSDLRYRLVEEAADPFVYVPMVDFDELEDPSIIDAFWRKSVFFWSEEHAREYRREAGGERGLYLTLAQSVFVTPLTQGPLFGFPPYGGRKGDDA